MRAATLLPLLAGATLSTATTHVAQLYYQPVTPGDNSHTPVPLASIEFDPSAPDSAAVTSYEAPDLSSIIPSYASSSKSSEADDGNGDAGDAATSSERLLRIGTYDPSSARWTSSASVTSLSTFASKGYAPHLLLSVGADGTVLGAGARGVRIDAGATRDFGPQAVVLVTGSGKGVEMGKPVVLNPDGRKKGEEPEKSLLQKYWWVFAIGLFLLVSGGGDK